jgi:membrane protease YdiL (CAAX protease family)
MGLFLAAFFLAWSLRATIFYSIDEKISPGLSRVLFSQFIKLLLWVVPAFGFAWFVRRASPVQYLGISVLPTRKQWAICLGVTGAFLCAIIAFETVAGHKRFSFAAPSFSLIALIGLVVSPVLEEILFRGLVLKELAGLLSSWNANLITSALFVGIHLPFWLFHSGPTQAVLANAVGVFAFSLLAGWLYLRSRSIWPPVGVHILNNALAQLLVGF